VTSSAAAQSDATINQNIYQQTSPVSLHQKIFNKSSRISQYSQCIESVTSNYTKYSYHLCVLVTKQTN